MEYEIVKNRYINLLKSKQYRYIDDETVKSVETYKYEYKFFKLKVWFSLDNIDIYQIIEDIIDSNESMALPTRYYHNVIDLCLNYLLKCEFKIDDTMEMIRGDFLRYLNGQDDVRYFSMGTVIGFLYVINEHYGGLRHSVNLLYFNIKWIMRYIFFNVINKIKIGKHTVIDMTCRFKSLGFTRNPFFESDIQTYFDNNGFNDINEDDGEIFLRDLEICEECEQLTHLCECEHDDDEDEIDDCGNIIENE